VLKSEVKPNLIVEAKMFSSVQFSLLIPCRTYMTE